MRCGVGQPRRGRAKGAQQGEGGVEAGEAAGAAALGGRGGLAQTGLRRQDVTVGPAAQAVAAHGAGAVEFDQGGYLAERRVGPQNGRSPEPFSGGLAL